ncbi:MAG: hypothetical protein ACO3A4_10825 [Silvanigrellaceae bacterium]
MQAKDEKLNDVPGVLISRENSEIHCSCMRLGSSFRLFIALACLLGFQQNLNASSSETRDVTRIWISVNTRALSRQTDLEKPYELLQKKSFRMNHPHDVVNPQHVESEFFGITVRDLLLHSGIKEEQFGSLNAETITFVGRDSYSVSLPFEDVIKAQAVIVGFEKGQRLNWRKGAPFLAFLNHSKASYLSEQSWWAWWVSAIFIGKPDLNLEVNGQTLNGNKVGSLCSDKKTGKLNYPRGRRKKEPPRANMGELLYCPVSKVLALESQKSEKSAKSEKAQTSRKKLVVEYMTGQTQTLSEPARYELVRGFAGKDIPNELGGPYQLCQNDGKQECSYFVRGLREE